MLERSIQGITIQAPIIKIPLSVLIQSTELFRGQMDVYTIPFYPYRC